jgi:hypothetical protein
MLVGIVLLNLNQIDIVFRDISIALMTLTIVFWPKVLPRSP